MTTFMNTRCPLIENSSINPLDVIKIKSGLSTLGHYEAPQWGVSQFPDRALFRAIRDFQKSQGLKVDGVMKPEGETLAALQSRLRGAKERTATHTTAQALQGLGRGGDEILAHLTQGEAQLLHDITDGGSINPATGLLEFWYDYESDAAGVGSEDDNNGPDQPDKDNGNDNNGPGFLDNFIEDLGRILSGTANSPHSANDVRNANAMAAKTGGNAKDFLPGGYFGPGGGGYSPSAHHNAGQQALAQERADRAQKLAATAKQKEVQKKAELLSTKAAPTPIHALSTPLRPYLPEQKPPQAPAAAAAQSVLSPTVNPIAALSTSSTTDIADLKNQLAQAEMAAWSSSATPAAQARNLNKLQDLRDKIKKAEAKDKKATESQNQKAANVGEQPLPGPEKQTTPELSAEAAASNDRLAETLAKTTDLSTAADYINDALKSGGPQAQLEVNDLVQSLEDLQPGQGQKLAELAGMMSPQNAPELTEAALMQDQKAADVGEQPVVPQNPDVANTLVEGFRTSTLTSRQNFVAQIEKLIMRDPEALKSLHPEIESYYEAFQKTLRSATAFRPKPIPSEASYEAKKKTYDVWAVKRTQQADHAGLNAAYSHHAAQGLGTPLAELGEKTLSGWDALDDGNPNAVVKAELQHWLDRAVPEAYRNAPLYLDDLKTGSVLAWGVDTFTPVGAFTAADDVAKTLDQAGMTKAVQVVGAKIATALHVFSGPLAKLSLKKAKPFLQEISTAIKQRFGADLSQLTSKELENLVGALGEEGIQMAADGTVKGIGGLYYNPKDKGE